MRIPLMANIPHERILRTLKNVMKGDGELDDAKARRQVATILGCRRDDFLTDYIWVCRHGLRFPMGRWDIDTKFDSRCFSSLRKHLDCHPRTVCHPCEGFLVVIPAKAGIHFDVGL